MFRGGRSAMLMSRLIGVVFAVSGIAVIIRFVPPAFWIFLGGLVLIFLGWRLFQRGHGFY